jgi:hypothetical protein
VSWQGCTYAADDGAEFMAAELVDPEIAEGIGDAAVWMSDRLHFKVGDRGFTASALTASGDPADRDQVEALAQATVAALG